MASFNVTGMDDLIRQMDLKAEEIKRLGPTAAKAGGEAALEAMKKTVPKGKGKTHELESSLKIDGPYHNVSAGYYCDVHPDGKRASGERNATVGYVLEYGRSNMAARPWMRTAVEMFEADIQDAMAKVLTGGGGA